jgi:hypothetical protein
LLAIARKPSVAVAGDVARAMWSTGSLSMALGTVTNAVIDGGALSTLGATGLEVGVANTHDIEG